MFDKERFHNALALSLGYERIVKDKRITIVVEESDDPWVTLKFQGCPDEVRIKASDDAFKSETKNMLLERKDLLLIADIVHQAYQEASNSRF